MLRKTLAHGQVTGTIAKTVLAYCDSCVGLERTNAVVGDVATKHGLTVGQLREADTVMSYLVVEDLYPVVIRELQDPEAIFQAGMFSANMQAIGVFLFGVVRLLGGTKFVYQKTADLTPRFANTGTMRCLEAADGRAVLEFEMYKDLRCTEAGFDYRRGLMASTPLPFGANRPADVTILGCQARGDPKDVFLCEW